MKYLLPILYSLIAALTVRQGINVLETGILIDSTQKGGVIIDVGKYSVFFGWGVVVIGILIGIGAVKTFIKKARKQGSESNFH